MSTTRAPLFRSGRACCAPTYRSRPSSATSAPAAAAAGGPGAARAGGRGGRHGGPGAVVGQGIAIEVRRRDLRTVTANARGLEGEPELRDVARPPNGAQGLERLAGPRRGAVRRAGREKM